MYELYLLEYLRKCRVEVSVSIDILSLRMLNYLVLLPVFQASYMCVATGYGACIYVVPGIMRVLVRDFGDIPGKTIR